ncbi:uncharacterized protein SPSK_06135 [Sporothrix schenckii 1099-18]|uniref:DUF7605 domain-containing protein n=1 Tax=Sporothrix schenckii 1099-18 TaxID=1397361 RepID=A0A0F2ML57_SPOSC|nr:uncharacterized protein SPSK_06135 [Sporothrix schenckii 1099-18]KJR89794.1 hypothetical protein SPSK_06135 [Sporothrix schenckii 1099-18]
MLTRNCNSITRLQMEDRNKSVQRELTSTYRNRLPGGIQNVFCVDNKQYWELWTKEGFVQHLPVTGIPRLRTHCLGKVAESRLKLAAKHVRDSIPALLAEVELWVESGARGSEAEQKKIIVEALDRAEADLEKTLVHRNVATAAISTSSMRNTFDDKIYKSVEFPNYGTHTTEAVGYHSWNEEAIKCMVDDLKQPWSDVLKTLRDVLKTLCDEHSQSLRWIERNIDRRVNQLEMKPSTPSALLKTIQTRNDVFMSDVEKCVTAMESALRTLGIKAFSGLRTGLFGMAMEHTYSSAMLMRGRGCTQRKISAINATLGDPNTFAGVIKAFRDEFLKVAQRLEQDVQGAIDNYLSAVRTAFDIVRTENAAKESESDRPFTDRVSASVTAAKRDLERLQSVFGQR